MPAKGEGLGLNGCSCGEAIDAHLVIQMSKFGRSKVKPEIGQNSTNFKEDVWERTVLTGVRAVSLGAHEQILVQRTLMSCQEFCQSRQQE